MRRRFARPLRALPAHLLALSIALSLVSGWLAAPAALAQGVDVNDLLQPSTPSQIEFTVSAFGPGDVRKTETQREQVTDLARRRLGMPIGRDTKTDIETMQRLLDGGYVDENDTFMLQSFGVVLGDALARDMRILQWAVVDDKFGHSRALQYRTTDQVFFPVTMISKRVQHGETVDVQALYDQVKAGAEALEVNRDEHLRRTRGRR